MADWFARLMQRGHAREKRAVVGSDIDTGAGTVHTSDERDGRYEAVVQRLRDRAPDDRQARERRQRWYRQTLESDSATEKLEPASSSPVRLQRMRAKVPCRTSPEAEALLDQLRKRFAGYTISFSQLANGRQALMLGGRTGATRKQIGWIEHCVEADPKPCNVRSQGLSVETDGDSMLVLRFRYPSTPVRTSRTPRADEAPATDRPALPETFSRTRGQAECELPSGEPEAVGYLDFAELRPALELRPSEKDSCPRLVWITRPERETMNAMESRDYESFYVRFKLEIQAGVWISLSALLSGMPGSRWHHGSCYTIVHEPDAELRRIHQRTVDDRGRAIDIGLNRTYDAASATDILLLDLDGGILADCADIYFTLQSLHSADAYFLKEEFFTVIRRFWATAESLTSLYGGGLPAVMRMSQRAVPMPAQAPMLKQDWTNLRQYLVDRYGEGGRKAAQLRGKGIHRQRVGRGEWPFSAFPAGEVNFGLRLIYRQEWRHIGAQRGAIVRTSPLGTGEGAHESSGAAPEIGSRYGRNETSIVETIIDTGAATRSLDEVVSAVRNATMEAMKSSLDADGSIPIGARDLAPKTALGMESECRESGRDTSMRLTDVALKMASGIHGRTSAMKGPDERKDSDPARSIDPGNDAEVDCAMRVYSRLHNVYEVITRPAEIENVVLIAEKLPSPADIDRSWVRRNDWILAKVLLDDSFRDALEAIGGGVEHASERGERDIDIEARRERFYEHVRANILHYQRAIWLREDPQQRGMRYRKSGKKVPLEWRFELESEPELTIDVLADRLTAANVDGHFAAYSSGRFADLDQLIDPAGLIGYHGNYAVFRMRPEFGDPELFSLLHFFKSPYLGPDSQAETPDVDDPVRLQMCADIAERARRISLATNGMVIDVVRSAPPAEDPRVTDGDIGHPEAASISELVLKDAPGIGVLTLNSHDDSQVESAILTRRGGELLAGRCVAARGDESINDTDILTRSFGERGPTLCVGKSYDSDAEQEILASGDLAALATCITGVGAEGAERVIHSGVEGARFTGRPHDPKADSGIVTRHDRNSTVTITRRKEGAESSQAVVSLGHVEAATSLCIGRVHVDDESGIVEPASGGLILSSGTRGGAARAHERVILAADDAESTANLVAGAGAPSQYEHMVLAQDDEWLRPSLVVG